MGVLACDVKGCDNVMCDRFSWQLQKYICYPCFDRLKARGSLNAEQINAFFEEEPPLVPQTEVDVDKYYDKLFPDKDDSYS